MLRSKIAQLQLQSATLLSRPSCCRNIAALSAEIQKDSAGIKDYESMPGPKVYPFVGNPDYLKDGIKNMHLTQLGHARKYGPFYKDSILSTDIVVISDPEIAEEVYRSEDKWPYRDFETVLGAFFDERRKYGMSPSIVQLQGEEWSSMRRMFSKKMLQPISIKKYYPTFSDVAVDAVQCLKNMRNADMTIKDVRNKLLGRWSLESIGKFVYGVRTGLLDDDISEANKKLYHAITVVLQNSAWLSRHKMMKYVFRSQYKELKDGLVTLYNDGTMHAKTVVDHYKECEKTGAEHDPDIENSLFSYLMRKNDCSFNECCTHGIEMYAAGFDTTSITTTWLMYWLGRNSDVQEKLYQEVMQKIPVDGVITDDAVQKMPYLRACIKETNRLTPLAFSSFRFYPQDMVLRGYVIPANMQIHMLNYAMARDDKLFTDAESFMPERWLRGSDTAQDINPFASVPFGYGPRSCLGRRIAEAEIQVFIAQLVKDVKIEHIGEAQNGVVFLGLTPEADTTFAFHDR